MNCYYYKVEYDALFKNIPKRPEFAIRPLKSIIDFDVDILSLQQLEHEMDCTKYPDNYNCFGIGYCGQPNFPYANIQFKQATNLILPHFQ